jgi:hypothetical protein
MNLSGISVSCISVSGISVSCISVSGISVLGISVSGISVSGKSISSLFLRFFYCILGAKLRLWAQTSRDTINKGFLLVFSERIM